MPLYTNNQYQTASNTTINGRLCGNRSNNNIILLVYAKTLLRLCKLDWTLLHWNGVRCWLPTQPNPTDAGFFRDADFPIPVNEHGGVWWVVRAGVYMYVDNIIISKILPLCMNVCNLPRCEVCGSCVRYRRRTNDFACTYCPKIYTSEELQDLHPKPAHRAIKGIESTYDIDALMIFKQPAQPAMAATTATPANHYDLRSER